MTKRVESGMLRQISLLSVSRKCWGASLESQKRRKHNNALPVGIVGRKSMIEHLRNNIARHHRSTLIILRKDQHSYQQ